MKSKKLLIKFALPFLLGASVTNAEADCNITHIAGTWKVFGGSTSSSFEGFSTGRLTFASNGSLITGASVLRLSDGTVLNLSSGQATVHKRCRVTGNIATTIGITLTLIDGQMDINKSTIAGVYERSDGDQGLVNFVRK